MKNAGFMIYLFAKDWDFEWRALTWLPAYSSSEEEI